MSKYNCCDNNSWHKNYTLPKFLFGRKTEIHTCNKCGLGKTIPEPIISLNYYEENDKYDLLFTGKEELYKKFAYSLLKLLGRNKQETHQVLLDVGCGGGFLVQAANEMGFQASGIEANAGMVSWACERGIPIEQGDIQHKLAVREKYDIIVLSAVLEHVANPASLLIGCKKILKSNGVILVSQASFDGLLPRVFPWGWYGWQPKEHYWHFTPDSFSHLAASCGLKISFCERNSLYHRYYLTGDLKTLIGRNIATFIARLGNIVGRGDNFDCILVCETNVRELA